MKRLLGWRSEHRALARPTKALAPGPPGAQREVPHSLGSGGKGREGMGRIVEHSFPAPDGVAANSGDAWGRARELTGGRREHILHVVVDGLRTGQGMVTDLKQGGFVNQLRFVNAHVKCASIGLVVCAKVHLIDLCRLRAIPVHAESQSAAGAPRRQLQLQRGGSGGNCAGWRPEALP